MPDLTLPVYTAMVLDAVNWSDAGWCKIILRFPEVAEPFVVDELCPRDPKEVYPPGSPIAFTLDCKAFKVYPCSEEARIDYRWELSFVEANEEDYPLVPGSYYTVYGAILRCEEKRLVLDSGLVMKVTPPHGEGFSSYKKGDTICVTGHLGITRVAGASGPSLTLVRRRSL